MVKYKNRIVIRGGDYSDGAATPFPKRIAISSHTLLKNKQPMRIE